MKKLLKLIFIAVIAGITYKYLTDRNINLSVLFNKARELVNSAVEEIEKAASGTSPFEEYVPRKSGGQGDADNITVPSASEYSSGLPPYDVNLETRNDQRNEPEDPEKEAAYVPPEEYGEAMEYFIPEKNFQGSERFPGLDDYARSTPTETEASMESLVSWLMKAASTEIEKARLIFTWIATHVSYDDVGFNTGNYSDTSPEGVFRNRVSVCQGYSELFTALCRIAGLEAYTITGYAKGITYRPGQGISGTNHAWNAASIDGRWRLFDVTWASGYGTASRGSLVTVSEFDDYWFDASPEEAIFSHLPEEDRWQLMDRKISTYQFERMPYVSGLFFKMGFRGDRCLSDYLDGSLTSFPTAYLAGSDIKVVSMPWTGSIPAGSLIKLRVKTEEGVIPAYRNEGRIIKMTPESDEYAAIVRTVPGELSLMITQGGGSYQTLLEYVVN